MVVGVCFWGLLFGVGLNCFPRGCGSTDTLSVGVPASARGVDFICVCFVFGDFVCWFGTVRFVSTHTGEVYLTEPLEW